MIEASASKSFAREQVGASAARESFERVGPRRGAAVLTWLNLLCLDAPIVAVSWQWLFARSFNIPIAPGGALALFLTAWLIYLADRFGDNLSLNPHATISLRQRFCRRHRGAWIGALALIALADLAVIFTRLGVLTLAVGAAIGALASIYLLVNQAKPSLWRALPLKEIVIGNLFAGGTVVALALGLTSGALPGWLLFAALCALNCSSIAVWERTLDQGQNRISIATEFPKISRGILPALTLLMLLSAAFAFNDANRRALYLCLLCSAALLGFVHFYRTKIPDGVRTALADLVLLTPLFVWLAARVA